MAPYAFIGAPVSLRHIIGSDTDAPFTSSRLAPVWKDQHDVSKRSCLVPYGQFISYVAFSGSSFVIARLLTPHEVGVFTIAIATIGVLNTVVAFDIGACVVRATDLQPPIVDAAFTVNGLLACAILAAIYLLYGERWIDAALP